jgi:hypothetical protein
MSDSEGRSVLAEYVETARAAGDLPSAAWAATRLVDRAEDEAEAEYWNAVAADLAFEAGDKAGAERAFGRLMARTEAGSDAHRMSIRRLHALTAREDPVRGQALLAVYRDSYPEDHEALMELTLRSARAWMGVGELERARRVLEIETPHDTVEDARRAALLGRLAMMDGDPLEARYRLELATRGSGMPPGERIRATRWLSMLAVTDSSSAVRFGLGIVAAARGDPAPLTEATTSWLNGDGGGPLLSSLSADELAAHGFPDEAAGVRSALVRRWPRSPEAPAALLALARGEAPRSPGKAAMWLERLIVEYPESALAPVARRELAVLGGAVPGAS